MIEISLRVSEKLRINIGFQIRQEDFNEAGKFKEVLARILYQCGNRKSWKNVCDEDEIEQVIKEKKDTKKNIEKLDKALDKVAQNYSNRPECRYIGSGFFGKLDVDDEDQKIEKLIEPALVVLSAASIGKGLLQIINSQGEIKYTKSINEDFYYYCDEKRKNFVWTDFNESSMCCYCFGIYKKETHILKLVVCSLMMEAHHGKGMTELFQENKDDWNDYYA